ncbi:ABC transporter ATP-binding protein [Castellaniella defragrans]|jgi:branched-chain amino acid transport system ATP-binding protein|uniref:Branched-chain amino acid transport system ATP-binding protein n=1 Tax=Castellaniella defragrans TaxID=75697 RepID=A0A7W9TM58_CASDE|nr:ABC transporter ATP-binding protein [Castellaniella defragrans]KAB0609130.1 ABC transporter ATP-binding protein [Castellaniella defragrans]MBB6083260.1 branched-chain amino acid transport system ATP-binding protein [Castellaniella defragrans]
MPALIEAAGLDTYYGESHIIRAVDLRIDAGESVGLLGRNGMGKTTLIRTLVGHVRPARGTITIRGRAAPRQPHRIARLGIAYVPEGRGIFPNLSVRENLLVAARPGHSRRSDWSCERVLALFPRLGERLAHGGGQLSGGEQQMLAIGRALMTNPDVLILDEATEGLAPLVIAEIWRVIREVRATGVSTLIVDRNYGKVLAHTDRCLILQKGEVVAEGGSAAMAARTEDLRRYLGV